MSKNLLIKGPVTLTIISSLMESLLGKNDLGGHAVFLGQVRADIVGLKRVRAIDYSAYDAMAVAEAQKIVNSILTEFSDVNSVEILHSVGIVNAGEFSLFVLVSAGHRKEAMKACSKTVELIKEKLPVWKKEIYEDDTHEWKENTPA